jgi:hypothetical protein
VRVLFTIIEPETPPRRRAGIRHAANGESRCKGVCGDLGYEGEKSGRSFLLPERAASPLPVPHCSLRLKVGWLFERELMTLGLLHLTF